MVCTKVDYRARLIPVQKSVTFCLVGKYIGSRPVRLKKSLWKERSFVEVKKREKEERKKTASKS